MTQPPSNRTGARALTQSRHECEGCGARPRRDAMGAIAVFNVILLALLALFGCSSPTDATGRPDAVAVAMFLEGVPVTRGAIVGMLPGTTLHFVANMKDAAGATVTSVHPTVVSRNVQAISIDGATGLMHVVGRGNSWLVAGYNSATRGLIADSVTVSVVCTTEARAALNVTVADSVTGSAGGITSLSISARQGNLRDSVFYPVVSAGTGAVSLGLAIERAGTWDLRINADGYKPWAALGVPVSSDLCHVIPVALNARLQRALQ